MEWKALIKLNCFLVVMREQEFVGPIKGNIIDQGNNVENR